jgi:hypothetical protein
MATAPVPSNNERRDGGVRYDVRLGAEVVRARGGFTCCTRNLSIGGVCLETPQLLVEGSTIQLLLFLVVDDIEDTTRAPLELRASVAWSTPANGVGEPATAGLRFESPSLQQRERIERFLDVIVPDLIEEL